MPDKEKDPTPYSGSVGSIRLAMGNIPDDAIRRGHGVAGDNGSGQQENREQRANETGTCRAGTSQSGHRSTPQNVFPERRLSAHGSCLE
jgi:hypothetical protein